MDVSEKKTDELLKCPTWQDAMAVDVPGESAI